MNTMSALVWIGWLLVFWAMAGTFAAWKLAMYLDAHPERLDEWLARGKRWLGR